MPTLDRRARPLLGTFVEIGLRPADPAVFAKAFERIERVHHLMSAHAVDSDLAEISRNAHSHPVTVDAATAEVIAFSLKCAEASAGAFDPVRAGVALIHQNRRPNLADHLPDRGATWRDLEIRGHEVRASRPLALDLGGVAKGYAVDQAAAIIAAHGCSGVVNAGGDLRFIGHGERIASIRRPDAMGEFFQIRDLPRPALATTGSYSFSDEGGNLDLIASYDRADVSTGFSITVFAEDCATADAMTKVVLNLQDARAAEVLRAFNCHALILESDGRFRELP